MAVDQRHIRMGQTNTNYKWWTGYPALLLSCIMKIWQNCLISIRTNTGYLFEYSLGYRIPGLTYKVGYCIWNKIFALTRHAWKIVASERPAHISTGSVTFPVNQKFAYNFKLARCGSVLRSNRIRLSKESRSESDRQENRTSIRPRRRTKNIYYWIFIKDVLVAYMCACKRWIHKNSFFFTYD